ncbi:MAG TPA: hypothetical protein VFL76_10150 [Edaphocola sp.]|nr:hypothetical protein [Edaphocola sp.]
MAFQDLLKKQINNLGKELNELLERVLPLNDPDLVSMLVTDDEQKVLPVADGRLADLVLKSPEELQQLFTGKDSAQMENLELLADLFAAVSKKMPEPAADHYAWQAAALYQYITDRTATFSFSRMAKIAGLRK